jgi:GcrA cell cycle regulator
MRAEGDFDWTAEAIATLRQGWFDGLSTAAIGRRLGVSKNSIVSKARRVDLPVRQSPIIRNGVKAPPPAPRIQPAPRVTLPPLPPQVAYVPAALAKPLPVSLVPTRTVVVVQFTPSNSTCCWPIGDPGTKAFRFCDDAAAVGKPYCLEHCGLAYVKVRHRAEAEA